MSFESNIRAIEREVTKAKELDGVNGAAYLVPDGVEIHLTYKEFERKKRITWHDVALRRFSSFSHDVQEMVASLIHSSKIKP